MGGEGQMRQALTSGKASLGRASFAAVILSFLWGVTNTATSQEAVRMSIASAQAAEARRRAESSIGYYNLKLGPTGWRFGTGLAIEYNDNVENKEENKESDFIFRPQINAQMIWPLSEKNSINLSLGAGYSVYVDHSRLDRLFLTPGSELGFNLYVGDFWINFHDRFSLTEDSYQDPTVSGTGDFARFENAIGVSALWDLNKVIVRSGYDHITYISLGANQGQPDGESEVLSVSAGYALKPGMLLGVELGGGLLHYDSSNLAFTDARQWNAGVFYEGQLSEYMSLHGSVGYTVYTPDQTGLTNAPGDFTGLYANLGITHRVNQYVDYTLNGGRTINFAFYGGTIDLYYARLQVNWRILRKISLGTSFDFEHGTQLTLGTETFDRYGPSITLGRTITSKLSATLGYQYFWRGSDVAGQSYTINVVSLSMNYAF